MLNRYKLRVRITVLLSIVFVLGFVVQGYLSTSFLHQSYVEKLRQEQFNRAATMADAIDRKLITAQQALISVAQVFPVKQFGDADFSQAWLDDRRALLSTFDNGLFIFSNSGKLLVESPYKSERRGRNYSFRSYFQETVRTDKPYISDPYISSQSHNHPAIMMTAPIHNQQGDLVAILGGSFDLLAENFLGDLASHKLGENGYFYLASMDRTLIAHPDSTRIMQQDVPVGANLLFDRAMNGYEGCDQTINSKGLAFLTAFKRLKTKNWVLGGNYPMSEINAPLNHSRQIVWMSISVTFLLMFLVSLFLFRQIFRPMFSFTEHLEQLASKQGAERIAQGVDGGEIGIMVGTFNRVLREADEARQSLDYAQQMAHLGNWAWDMNSNEISWSDEVYRIFGDEPKSYQATYELFLAKIHPDDRSQVEAAVMKSLKTGQAYEIEHRIVLAEDTLRYVKEKGEVKKSAGGKTIGMVGTVQDVTDIILLQNKLRNLATTDELTGAANRRQLFSRAEALLQKAIRYKNAFSVLFFDLDHFKEINDSYGHPAGDEVLQQLTAIVQSLLRDTDILARYGGEEFCILTPETDEQNAAVLAERIRSSIESQEITLKTGTSLKLTVSVGVTDFRDTDTVSTLIERADQAVYRAKQLGRNRVYRS